MLFSNFEQLFGQQCGRMPRSPKIPHGTDQRPHCADALALTSTHFQLGERAKQSGKSKSHLCLVFLGQVEEVARIGQKTAVQQKTAECRIKLTYKHRQVCTCGCLSQTSVSVCVFGVRQKNIAQWPKKMEWAKKIKQPRK